MEKCSICKKNEVEIEHIKIEHIKYGLICNSCDCNLLEIENNIYCKVTEEEFVNSFN